MISLFAYRIRLRLFLFGMIAMFWSSLPAWAQESASAAAQPVDWLSRILGAHGFWVGLLAVFVGGLALNLTPCVYPMIPVTLAFFSQQANRSIGRTLQLALLYVVGISCSYALLGVLAAKTGALLGAWLQQPLILLLIASMIVALSLSMFGLYEFRLPGFLTRRIGQASTGLWGACAMGLMVGLVAAPCIGPFVLGLFLYTSQQADVVRGFLLFFTLGLGMGSPYLLLGMAANRIGQLPKSGAWMAWMKKVLGVVLLALALYFIRPIVPAGLLTVLVIALLLWAGIYLGWLERTPSRSTFFLWVRRLVGATLILCAIFLAWPRPHPGATVSWQPYSEARLAEAQRNGQPAIIDIYADWCLPCVEMDRVTFHHAEGIHALGSVVALRIDVTRDVPPDAEALVERLHIFGVPTVLLFDRNGHERQDLRITGFVSPEDMVQRLAKLQ